MNTPSLHAEPERRAGQIRILEVLIVLAKRKRFIVGTTMAVTVATVIALQFFADIYTSNAQVLPPQTSGPAGALLAQFGGLANTAGSVLGLGGIRSPGELQVAMLRSRTVSEAVVDHFDLGKHYGNVSKEEALYYLFRATRILLSRDGIISIEVDDEEPQKAADVANGYVEELKGLNQRLAVSEAARRRVFFEDQLKQAKENLIKAETAFKEAQEKTGLLRLEDQGRVSLETVARLRAEIAAKEVQIQVMQSFATVQNPDLFRAQRELVELRAQAEKLERDDSRLRQGVLIPTKELPEAALEYLRRFRDVKYQETMFELMAKQFEIAKLDEARDASIIQVLDPAIPPKARSKPRRVYISIIVAIASFLASIIIAFFLEAIDRIKSVPNGAERFETLRKYLGWRE